MSPMLYQLSYDDLVVLVYVLYKQTSKKKINPKLITNLAADLGPVLAVLLVLSDGT